MGDSGCLFMHALFERLKGDLFVLLLPILYLLEDIPDVELHATNEWHLKHKGSHEVIEYIAAFLLQVYGLILFKVPEDLIVSHGQLHHSIDFSFQFILVELFESGEVLIALSHFLSLIFA